MVLSNPLVGGAQDVCDVDADIADRVTPFEHDMHRQTKRRDLRAHREVVLVHELKLRDGVFYKGVDAKRDQQLARFEVRNKGGGFVERCEPLIRTAGQRSGKFAL